MSEETPDNVIPWNGATTNDIDPDVVLDGNKGDLSKVLLVGWDHEGQLVIASSFAKGSELMWLLERAKHTLHVMCDADEG